MLRQCPSFHLSGGWPGLRIQELSNSLRSNEEAFACSQLKATRRVPQVRLLNCLKFEPGSWVAFSSHSSRIHRNHSLALITVRPSFSTIRCKTLNIFIKVCYSLPCILALSLEESNLVLASLFPRLPSISVYSASLR